MAERCRHLKFLLVLAFLPAALLFSAEKTEKMFYNAVAANGLETALEQGEDGTVSAPLAFPGGCRVYRTRDRQYFRADPAQFNARYLTFEAELQGAFRQPVKAWIYVKNKDGLWYQTEQEYKLYPGEPAILQVRIDRRGAMLPSGHGKIWCGEEAACMFEAGVSLYSEEKVSGKLILRGPVLEGEREKPPLEILYWDLPEKAEKHRMFESRFALSRDYFNPFDPEEIRVDYELDIPPEWSNRQLTAKFFPFHEALPVSNRWKRTTQPPGPVIFPAFYTVDFRRSRHFTEELLTPEGHSNWAFRMTPRKPGPVRVRLRVTDRSSGKEEVLVSPWRTIEVIDSDLPGFVRVRKNNPRYFEFSNGEFFFPVSLNIHTNIDRRSERQFKWGLLPDSGTYDYDEYFRECGKNGITLLEIWMASWTCALEWDSARKGYYGVGRYNMENAWRLDHLFRLAEQNGVYINLVLAPHGELSYSNDQEWDDNPFNKNAWYAKANGAFLATPDEFWSHPDVYRYTYNRNRYIAARWGASPHLFAYEFWSEVNLVNAGDRHRRSGFLMLWHNLAADATRENDYGQHLMSTHTCSDAATTHYWRDVCIEPERFTHIVSDAYRSPSISFFDQLLFHEHLLNPFEKPAQVTEFGGTSMGSNSSLIMGDIHSGLWASFFAQQSASPALWWHDVIHFNNYYNHYKAFSEFLKGEDPGKEPVFKRTQTISALLPEKILNSPEAQKDPGFLRGKIPPFHHQLLAGPLPGGNPAESTRAMLYTADKERALGWVFRPRVLHNYPLDETKKSLSYGALVYLDLPMKPGDYILDWHSTLTGKSILKQEVQLDGFPRYFPVPRFFIDIAFKLYPAKGADK